MTAIHEIGMCLANKARGMLGFKSVDEENNLARFSYSDEKYLQKSA